MTIGNLLPTRFLHLIPMGLLLVLAVGLRIIDPQPIAQLRLNVFDSLLRGSPRQADPDFPVRIVAIDEASLERLGQWPWPRSVIARIVDRLREAGARSIVFDVILPEPDRMSPRALVRAFEGQPGFGDLATLASKLPSNDDLLADAISKAPTVLGFSADNERKRTLTAPRVGLVGIGDDPKSFVPSYTGGVSSLDVLTKGARGLGAVNWIPDQDLVLRRVPLLVSAGGQVYPSLSLEAFRVGSGADTILYRASGGSSLRAFGQRTGIELVKVGKTTFPTKENGEMWLRFAQADSRRYLSAYRVLEDGFDSKEVAGRHVLIGASAAGLLDLRATPLAASVPGVEVHAQALEQMLSGDHVVRPAYAVGLELAFLIGVGALVAWLIGLFGPLVAAIAGVFAIAGVAAVSWFSFSRAGVLLDPVYPSLALVGLYLAGSLSNFVRAERERAQVRAAFSNYVAPQLVEQLANDPGKLKLGGETREITLLFSDVRQFSRISEGLDAAELIAFVNRLFTPLADIILDKRGTIDKFMGDAVMAFWNAPVADREHAAQACLAALAMMAELERLNVTWEATARERGEDYVPVRIGIGLNTGECCVGNVGSPQRFDYSILGDVVNVASRLESVTKIYGAGIIAGERLREVAGEFAFVELDRVTLRGKSIPQSIYALLGDENVSRSDAFQALARAHAGLIGALNDGDRDGARAAFETCRALAIPSYQPIVAYFEGVIEKTP